MYLCQLSIETSTPQVPHPSPDALTLSVSKNKIPGAPGWLSQSSG